MLLEYVFEKLLTQLRFYLSLSFLHVWPFAFFSLLLSKAEFVAELTLFLPYKMINTILVFEI